MTATSLTKLGKGRIHEFTEVRLEKLFCSMGVRPGSHIEIVKKAPFGSVFYCMIDHKFRIALRKLETDSILLCSSVVTPQKS